jgi:hypothetical protein
MSTNNSSEKSVASDSITPSNPSPGHPAPVAASPPPASVDQSRLDAELLEITDGLAKQVRECQANSLAWLLKVGGDLLETRKYLEPGEWTKMFALGRLPIGLRSAQSLNRIVGNVALRTPKNLRHLPSSISALDELAVLDSALIDQGIHDGKIRPAMTAAEAKAFVRQQRQETKVEQRIQNQP